VKFWIKGNIFALQIAKSMVIAASKNPMAALGLIMAIAAGPPGWVGLAVAVAAQGMAMAAGVRDPTTLALIGAVAGAAAGGLTAMLMSGAKFGAERALVAAGIPPTIVSACSLMYGVAAVNSNTKDPDPGSGATEGGLSGPRLAGGPDPEFDGTATDAPAADYSNSKGSLKDLMCQEEASNKVIGDINAGVNAQQRINDYTPINPEDGFNSPWATVVSAARTVGQFFGIVSPMVAAVNKKPQYYNECMARTDNNL